MGGLCQRQPDRIFIIKVKRARTACGNHVPALRVQMVCNARCRIAKAEDQKEWHGGIVCMLITG